MLLIQMLLNYVDCYSLAKIESEDSVSPVLRRCVFIDASVVLWETNSVQNFKKSLPCARRRELS
jgi:hypothetical protein